MNKWLFLLGGFVAGIGVGGLSVNYFNNKKFDEVVDDIYNECYADAKEQIEKEFDSSNYHLTKEELESETTIIQNEYADAVIPYKPSLEDLMIKPTGPDGDSRVIIDKREETINQWEPANIEEEIDEEYIQRSFEEDNNVVSERGSEAHLITETEFRQENLHYAKCDVFYYSVDNIFADDEDQVLDVDDPLFEFSREVMETRIRQDGGVYVRIPSLDTDFEIHLMKSSYRDIAYETYKERGKRIAKRKLREEN